MKNNRQVLVNPDFIKQALYDRYDDVKDLRWKDIHEKVIDDFVDLIADCWTNASSAWEIVDNWLVNWENWDYEDCWRHWMNEPDEWENSLQQIEQVEQYLEDNWYFYDRELEEFCSY